jgi:hypothetical protein
MESLVRVRASFARLLLTSFLVAAGVVSGVPNAFGAPEAGVQSNEDRAFQLYQAARAFYERGEFEGARTRLKDAWALFPHPALGLKLSDVYEKLGMPEEALESLKAIKTNEPEFRQQIEVRSRALDAYLQQPLKVSVMSAAEQTTVVIDHKDRRIAPFDVQLARGIHVFEARAVGFRAAKRVVNVRGAQPVLVRFDLQPLTGTLSVRSPDDNVFGLKVQVDGRPWKLGTDEHVLKRTRARIVRVGAHPFVCWRDGHTKDVRTVMVREAEDVVVDCRTRPIASEGAQEVWAWVAAGAGIGSAGAATFLLISYQQDVQKADRENLNMETNKHIFGGIFAVTAVACGVGSYFLFQSAASDDADERVGWRVMPILDPSGGVGAAAAFTF